MTDLSSILLPAIFGLVGTLIGGLLTVWGQHRADSRAYEKKCEEHYYTLAAELTAWLTTRNLLIAEALGSSTKKCVELLTDVENNYPVSDFALRINVGFPELFHYCDPVAALDTKISEVLTELLDGGGQNGGPIAQFDEESRRQLLNELIAVHRPILAGLTRAQALAFLGRPRRLDAKLVMESARAAERG